MFCNASAFRLASGCPRVEVNLSFPTLGYCASQVEFSFVKPELQVLRAPANYPTPDVAGPDIPNCIDIEPIVNINVRSIYDTSGMSHFAAHAISSQERGNGNTFSVKQVVLSGGSYAAGDCADGNYRLVLNFNIPCILDSWPKQVGVKNAAGASVGQLKFTHLSGCRITGEMELNMACSGTLVVERCPMDNINPYVTTITGTAVGNLKLSLLECSMRAQLNFPLPSYSTYGLWVDIIARNPVNQDKRNNNPNWFYATLASAKPYFSMPHVLVLGNVSLPYLMSVVITGATGISVNMVTPVNPLSDKFHHKYEIFSKQIYFSGYTGVTGPSGQRGETLYVFVGRTGGTGSNGLDGTNGIPGKDLTCRGARGPRGQSITCKLSVVYPDTCTNPGGSTVIRLIQEAEMFFYDDGAGIDIDYVEIHMLYAFNGSKYRITAYNVFTSRTIEIPVTAIDV